MEKELPQSTDKLFIKEMDPSKGAWISTPANKFFLYSEGYKEAGKKIYEYCIENPFYNNLLIYPMIYNYRQFLELRLKELILMSNEYVETGEDFPDEHSLMLLWTKYRKELLPDIESSMDLKMLNNVEKLICEFNTVDPKSMSFRYPLTKAPNRVESLKMPTIDIVNFKKTMDKLICFFEWQWDMISHYKDLKQEILSDYYGEYLS